MLFLGVLQACEERPVPNVGVSRPFDERDPDNRTLRERGFALRSAIDHFYAERTERSGKTADAEVTKLVEGFLPVEMPFAQAEQILLYAGFRLDRSSDHYPRSWAEITPYVKTFPIWTDFGVALYPTGKFEFVADPNAVDWTRVKGLDAGFIVIWP